MAKAAGGCRPQGHSPSRWSQVVLLRSQPSVIGLAAVARPKGRSRRPLPLQNFPFSSSCENATAAAVLAKALLLRDRPKEMWLRMHLATASLLGFGLEKPESKVCVGDRPAEMSFHNSRRSSCCRCFNNLISVVFLSQFATLLLHDVLGDL